MFADIADICILVYLEYILIFSKNKQEPKQHVHAMFKRLSEFNFHIQRNKCTLFINSIEFLVHTVSHRGIKVCPNKIEYIKDWLVPTSVHDIQSFLSLRNYFCHIISKFAYVAWPLTDLIIKIYEFSRFTEQYQAFDAYKQKLLDAPVLTVVDPVARSEVWCDASNFYVGAVLIQQSTPDSPQQPVEYFSKNINSAEYNYSATKREFVGLIQAVRTWCHYLYNRPTTIRIDQFVVINVLTALIILSSALIRICF